MEEFLKEVSSGGYSSAVLTDINNTSACIDYARRAGEFSIRPVVGIDFRNGAQQLFVGIAKNIEGFRELNEFLSKHIHNKEKLEAEAPDFKNVFIVYPFSVSERKLKKNEFIGLHSENLKKLPFSFWKNKPEKLVILQNSTFRNKREGYLNYLFQFCQYNRV